MHFSSLKKVIVVGGSGFIGTKLTEELLLKGYAVTVVDPVEPKVLHENLTFLKQNLAVQMPEPALFEGVYGVINLAGATIGKRWNRDYKKTLYDSRILTTRSVVQAIAQTITKPTVLVQASAVGYYGNAGDMLLKESSVPGNDFLSTLCIDWEKEALNAESFGTRVSIVRTAHVLGPGGLLSSLEPVFKNGLGGYFGNGKQYMPWIHYTDVVGIYLFLLEQNVSGAVNVSAGKTVSQKTLFTEFAQAIHAPLPFLWRIPHALAFLVLGSFADSLFSSQNTESEKIISAGYLFQFTDIASALIDIYQK